MTPPKTEITPEIFTHLVQLAALELEGSQADYLLGELNKQLASICELAAIDLAEDVPAASYGVPYPPSHKPALREDEDETYPDTSAITSQAPQFESGYIIVPDIPHTTLE